MIKMMKPVEGSDKLFICPRLCRGQVRTYIYRSTAGIGVMFHPEYAGMRLIEEMTKAAVDFWLALFWLEMTEERPLPQKNNLVEYILLTGGKYYCLREGLWELSKNFLYIKKMEIEDSYQNEYAGNAYDFWFRNHSKYQEKMNQFFDYRKLDIQQIYLGVRREEIHHGEWVANRYYDSFEYVPEGGFFVSGDTIASGITACESIAYLSNYHLMKGKKIDRLVVNSLFASEEGVKQIVNYAVDKFPDLKLDIFIGGALLDMDMTNKTDLWFFRDGRYQIDPLKRNLPNYPVVGFLLKCLTEDWGMRNKHPRQYLLKRLDEFNNWLEKLNSGFSAGWLTAKVLPELIEDLDNLIFDLSENLK